jgi:formiminotetrahydrofolate cyclodeaminase
VLDPSTSIAQFLDAAAAKQPTPGGGSVTALVAALAASMGEMVVNYSIGKKNLEQHAAELKSALDHFHSAREMLLELMVEDQTAYEALSAAKKMPESQERTEALSVAVAACIGVPQAMAATAVAILDLVNQLADKVNPYLLSDLAVCADLAMAAVRCALYNIRVNLPEISDEKQRWDIDAISGRLLSRATMIIQIVSTRIWQRAAAQGQK